MKRYLVFVGDVYYPVGGWCDFHSTSDSLETCIDWATGLDWGHIVDTETMEIIKRFEQGKEVYTND